MKTKMDQCSYLFNVLDFGAKGDGKTKDTVSINAAIERCTGEGGGTVYFPAGKYLTGTIYMKSNVTLQLEAGAEILGSSDFDDFPVIPANHFDGQKDAFYSPLIMGVEVNNISITGRGVINGQGQYWWGLEKLARAWRKYSENGITEPPRGEEKEFEAARKAAFINRPRTIQLFYCKNILMEGIMLKNSPFWTINPVCCDNLTLRGLTLVNPYEAPNTDGINPEACSNVHISDCHIDVGDDCITIKSGTEDQRYIHKMPCENITITNCTMKNGHGAVVIGSEMSGGVRNVVVSNCVIDGTDIGIRLKTKRGRGNVVEAVRVNNMVMKGVFNPMTMNMFYSLKDDDGMMPVTAGTPAFRNICFSNITAYDVRSLGFMAGLPEMPIERVSLENIFIQVTEEFDYRGRPREPKGDSRATEGLYCRYVKNITFHNVEVDSAGKTALNLEDGENIEVSELKISGSKKIDTMIKMNRVKNAYVHGCFAKSPVGKFIDLGGEGAESVVILGNHPDLA